MLEIALTFGAVYALVPLLIIIILIAAAAGISRGYDIFSIFGIGVLAGMGSRAGGKGSLGGKTAYKGKFGSLAARGMSKVALPVKAKGKWTTMTGAGLAAHGVGGAKAKWAGRAIDQQDRKTAAEMSAGTWKPATSNLPKENPPLSAPEAALGKGAKLKKGVKLAVRAGKFVAKVGLVGAVGTTAVVGGGAAGRLARSKKLGLGEDAKALGLTKVYGYMKGAGEGVKGRVDNLAFAGARVPNETGKGYRKLTRDEKKVLTKKTDDQKELAKKGVEQLRKDVRAPNRHNPTGGNLYETTKATQLNKGFEDINQRLKGRSQSEIYAEIKALRKDAELNRGKFFSPEVVQDVAISGLAAAGYEQRHIDAYLNPEHEKLNRIFGRSGRVKKK